MISDGNRKTAPGGGGRYSAITESPGCHPDVRPP
jgi:hypothetical protein